MSKRALYITTMSFLLSIGPAMEFGPRWLPPVLMVGLIVCIVVIIGRLARQ